MNAPPTLWDTPPSPPTGPQVETPTKAMNKYIAYQVWKRSVQGGKSFGLMLTEARRLLLAGAERISTKALVEFHRATYHVEFNNTWTAWLADDMVAADPRLLDVIERRVRRKRTTA